MPAFTSDERQLLHDSLQDYFENKYPFEHYRKLTSGGSADGFGRDAWADYAELGWLGVALPEAAGGSAGGMTELGIVMAASGGALALEPFLATLVLGAGAIERVGTAAQRELLVEVAGGKKLLAFCHGEPDAGYARDHVAMIAKRQGDAFILDGEKGFALHAHAADALVVSARLESASGPIALFLVAPDTAGVQVKPAPALDGRMGAGVALSGVTLPAGAKLGEDDDDKAGVIDDLIDRGALASCAEAAGAMAAVTAQTVEYLKSREQFGQTLSKFQVLQHRLVDMNIASEETRAVVHAALEAVDSGAADAQSRVWKAKVQTARSARFVGGQAIQLHGGMGMTDELAIGHYYKRLTMCETVFGDGEWYTQQLAARAEG